MDNTGVAVVHAVRMYGLLVGMWIRATMVYRASFILLLVGQCVITGLDFAVIVFMFVHTDSLGGFTLPEVAFLYATSGLALGIADLLLGNIERIGRRIRDGTLDPMLVRPVSVLVQAAADQFALRRFGRVVQAGAVLVWSLWALEIDWTWDRVLAMPIMLISGAAIFAGLFVLGAAFQFAASDTAQVANAFTYGGNVMTQYPPTIYPGEIIRAATFIVPLAFVNWIPAMHILGHPDPLNLPEPFRFAAPLVAAALLAVAGLAWRTGIRNYRSTGS